MTGGLDIASLYDQSGPALLGVLNLLVLVVWYDFRDKIAQAKEKAAEAVSEASAAKEKATEVSEKNGRQEILIDQVATDVDDVNRAVERNDQRIRHIQNAQAAAQGDDFFRGGDRDAASAEHEGGQP